MPHIHPLRKDIVEYLETHCLSNKWKKARALFIENPRHPSLRTEILEPKENLVYSFRIDRKYRAIFIVHDDKSVEVIKITKHYR